MGEIESTHLPGVGDRFDFVTEGGERLGIVSHRDGHRELVFYDRTDADRCVARVRLTEKDLQRLTDLSSAA